MTPLFPNIHSARHTTNSKFLARGDKLSKSRFNGIIKEAVRLKTKGNNSDDLQVALNTLKAHVKHLEDRLNAKADASKGQ